MFGVGKGLGQGILSLLQGLGKGGKQVISPATQARNMQISPTTQARNMQGAGGMATKLTEAKSKSLRHAAALYEDLVKRGVVNTNVRREDIIRKMDQYLSREYGKYARKGGKGGWNPDIPDASNFRVFPQELIRSLGDKAVWAALGGAAGYGVGRNQEAIQEMLNAVQLPTGIDIETTPVGELFGSPEYERGAGRIPIGGDKFIDTDYFGSPEYERGAGRIPISERDPRGGGDKFINPDYFGAPEEAPEQTDSDLWGPKVAEGLMDTIWPFPRD